MEFFVNAHRCVLPKYISKHQADSAAMYSFDRLRGAWRTDQRRAGSCAGMSEVEAILMLKFRIRWNLHVRRRVSQAFKSVPLLLQRRVVLKSPTHQDARRTRRSAAVSSSRRLFARSSSASVGSIETPPLRWLVDRWMGLARVALGSSLAVGSGSRVECETADCGMKWFNPARALRPCRYF